MPLASAADFLFPAAPARHAQVLRLQPGDSLRLFNGDLASNHTRGGEFEATILRMGRREVEVRIGAHHAVEREAARPVHLALGMPANERMDWLVEKATELGVASIQPLVTERTVLRLSTDRAQKKQQHWQAIAVAACEQCGRNRVPLIAPVLGFADWLQSVPAGQGWVLSLGKAAQSLDMRVVALGSALEPVTVLSGPEGGLTVSEERSASAKGFARVSLGPRVLRAETAALATLVALTLDP